MKSGSTMSDNLQELQKLTESLQVYLLSEEGYRYPFRHKADLGKGPEGKHHHKAGIWDCDDCGKSKCRNAGCQTACDCVGIGSNEGHKKHVEIKKAYKDAYDKKYKAGGYPHWRERRSTRAKRTSKAS